MFKILILVGIILIIYILFFKKTKDKSIESETMLECDKCGTYISSKEAVTKGDKHFCSSECARIT